MASNGQRFRRRALRRGYKVDEVDAFLDRVEATLNGEPGAAVTASERAAQRRGQRADSRTSTSARTLSPTRLKASTVRNTTAVGMRLMWAALSKAPLPQ